MAENTTKSKSRGIIIVDTVTLMNMCKKPRLSRNKENFLAPLAYLAQHGFKVIIPEFVLLEITNKCPDRNLEHLLNRIGQSPNHPETRRAILDFLEENGHNIVIEKARPKDGFGNTLSYYQICKLVSEAVEMAQPGYAEAHQSELPVGPGLTKDSQCYWEDRVAKNIKNAFRLPAEHSDQGEGHCFRVMIDTLVREFTETPDANKTPIYILTDDHSSNRDMLLKEFADPIKKDFKHVKKPPILNLVTTSGFFRALGIDDDKKPSLLKKMGYLEKPDAVLHTMYTDHDRYEREWNHPLRDKGILVDPTLHNAASFPFMTAIRNLRRDLEQSRECFGPTTAPLP